jgi:hypothetical protein
LTFRLSFINLSWTIQSRATELTVPSAAASAASASAEPVASISSEIAAAAAFRGILGVGAIIVFVLDKEDR